MVYIRAVCAFVATYVVWVLFHTQSVCAGHVVVVHVLYFCVTLMMMSALCMCAVSVHAFVFSFHVAHGVPFGHMCWSLRVSHDILWRTQRGMHAHV